MNLNSAYPLDPLTVAMDRVKDWDGQQVEDILGHLESARVAIKAEILADDAYDDQIALTELLEEKSKWPAAYQEENCEFAIAADAAGKYISWEFPDDSWWNWPLKIGRFESPEE